MKDVIRALVELQTIDNEIHKYQVQKNKLAETLDELKDLVTRMEQSVEEKKNKLKEVEKWHADQSDTLREYNERISKIKASLAGITKTKDYLMRQKELENLRRHKQTKEDEIEKVKETINDFRDAIGRDMAKIAELRKDTEQEGGATWDQVKQLEATISHIARKREHLLPLVPRQIISRYEQIKGRRDGIAIVQTHEGCCGGCHVQLRAQLYNRLLHQDSIETCPTCTRFIYAPEKEVKDHHEHHAAEPATPPDE